MRMSLRASKIVKGIFAMGCCRQRLLVAGIFLCVWGCGGGGGGNSGALQSPPSEPVRKRLDVAYAQASARQKLDLYLPATGTGPFPLVVWIHGGGWRSDDKSLAAGAPQLRLLDRGFAVASLNYRFSYEATFPAQIHDVKAALRFLRSQATAYGLDANRIAVWGFSAGGHLAALAGTSAGVAALEDLSQGNAGASSRVQAVIDWSGPIDFLQLDAEAAADRCPDPGYDSPTSAVSALIGAPITARPDLVRTANPITYISADAPPFLIQHGTLDCSVSPQQSQLLSNALGWGRATLELLAEGHGGPLFATAANSDRLAAFLDLRLK